MPPSSQLRRVREAHRRALAAERDAADQRDRETAARAAAEPDCEPPRSEDMTFSENPDRGHADAKTSGRSSHEPSGLRADPH